MKKIFLITVVLMLTTPAWAAPPTVTITAGPNAVGDANEVLISYTVVPAPATCEDGNRPRAFGLNFSVTDGNIVEIDDYFEGECDDTNKGYGIFPGRIEIAAGAVTSFGNPLARDGDPDTENTGLDTNTVILEMGSLYVDTNCPSATGVLCMLRVSLDTCLEVTGNASRAGAGSDGVVLDNLGGVTVVFVDSYCPSGVSVFVPDVVGMTHDVAKATLEAADLEIGDIVWECNSADFNEVIEQFPFAGAEVPAETEINIWKSLGDCDWGDANDPPYPTLGTNNGAVHSIAVGVYLGATVDAEPNGQPNATATGDDIAGVPDDEDGVVISGGTGLIAKGALNAADVNASVAGYLNAWLDKNADGDWDDDGEQIFTDQILGAGMNNLTFTVSCDSNSGITVSRWRYTTYNTSGNLSYEGPALDGEVEDHQVEIVCHVPDVVDMNMADANAILEAACFNVGDITYECNDTIADGNVISTEPAFCNYPDCNSDVNMVVSTGDCPVVEDCIAGTNPAYDDWVIWGEPNCWCFSRNCRGDADGIKVGEVWVTSGDITILRNAAYKDEATLATIENGICADFDRIKVGEVRVTSADIAIIRNYAYDAEEIVPECGTPPDPNYNFWLTE